MKDHNRNRYGRGRQTLRSFQEDALHVLQHKIRPMTLISNIKLSITQHRIDSNHAYTYIE